MRLDRALISIVFSLVLVGAGITQTVKTVYVDQTSTEDWNPGFKIGREFPSLLVDHLKIGGVSLTQNETNADAVLKCEPSIVITIHGSDPSKSVYSCRLISAVGKKNLWKVEVSFLEMKNSRESDERAADSISKKFLSRYRKGIKY